MKGWHKAAIAILVVSLLLAVIVPFMPRTVRAGTYYSTYNFVDITSPSSTHKTWTGNLTINPLDPPTSYAGGTFAAEINERRGPGLGYEASELDNAGYNAIEASDDSRFVTDEPSGSNNAALWHEFVVTIDPLSITRLDIKWEGYQDSSLGAYLWVMVWNYEYGVYHVLEASANTSDHEYTGSITSNCDHFFSSRHELTVMAYNDISDDIMYCDYVEVVVIYESTFTSVLNTSLTGWGWCPDEQRGIGNVTFPVAISEATRTDSTEVSDIRFIGTLNLTYTDNITRTFPLVLTGVKTRSLFYLRQHEVDINGSVWESSWRGTWFTVNSSGVLEHYIGDVGTIWLPHGNVSKAFNPYFFILRTPDVDIGAGTLGSGFVANVNNILYAFTRGFDNVFTAFMNGNLRDSLGDMLDEATVIIRELRNRLGPYIP